MVEMSVERLLDLSQTWIPDNSNSIIVQFKFMSNIFAGEKVQE